MQLLAITRNFCQITEYEIYDLFLSTCTQYYKLTIGFFSVYCGIINCLVNWEKLLMQQIICKQAIQGVPQKVPLEITLLLLFNMCYYASGNQTNCLHEWQKYFHCYNLT